MNMIKMMARNLLKSVNNDVDTPDDCEYMVLYPSSWINEQYAYFTYEEEVDYFLNTHFSSEYVLGDEYVEHE